MREIIYFQAGERLKEGEMVYESERDIIKKITADDKIVPLWYVLSDYRGDTYEIGDKVPTVSLWYDDRLMRTIRLNGMSFYKGDRKTEMKKALGIYRTRIVKCSKCGGKGEYEEEI